MSSVGARAPPGGREPVAVPEEHVDLAVPVGVERLHRLGPHDRTRRQGRLLELLGEGRRGGEGGEEQAGGAEGRKGRGILRKAAGAASSRQVRDAGGATSLPPPAPIASFTLLHGADIGRQGRRRILGSSGGVPGEEDGMITAKMMVLGAALGGRRGGGRTGCRRVARARRLPWPPPRPGDGPQVHRLRGEREAGRDRRDARAAPEGPGGQGAACSRKAHALRAGQGRSCTRS